MEMATDPGKQVPGKQDPKKKDPEKPSAYAGRDEPKPDAPEEEVDEGFGPGPTCPHCGWHNTRLSHTRGMLDSILRRFSFRAFRCRTCGTRFRTNRHNPKV
jgi:hypothetical protein